MDWADYPRDQSAKYRQLAETAEDLSVKEELLDLAAICEETANNIEDLSDAQRRPLAGAGWIRTIHHGLPERLLTPQPVAPAYFAFLGRISPEKAVDQAIWIAKRCGVPLKIAAKVDAVDRDYFESEIRKLLTPPDVEYIGEINDGEKSRFLSGAIALLAPIAW